MAMNKADEMASHTTQKYWQTHNKIEQCEKEMRVIIEELNELDNLYKWRSNLHQERFNFITKEPELLENIITLMDIYK